MRYLLYYKLDNEFVSDQIQAGGDGTNVVSIVDGVAWTGDMEKTYYRLSGKDEDISATTLTVHHKNIYGEQVAEDDVINVEYYIGKETTYTVFAKSIEGLPALETSKVVNVPEVTEYTMVYSDKTLNETPLTFVMSTNGTIVWKTSSAGYGRNIEYKKNDGEWIPIKANTGSSAPSISVVAGDKVQFRGNINIGYYYNSFSSSTGSFSLVGNIMSLVNSTGFTGLTTVPTREFEGLFAGCTGLTSAKNLVLPATTLNENCYKKMFNSCTNLIEAPELPATTLARYCYEEMFSYCRSLTTAPTELPALNLANGCYNCMFEWCESLNQAPELPATTLASSCYTYMFACCTSLTTAPELPAMSLASRCYGSMFSGCTSLAQAPALPATSLANSCYGSMFGGCTSLMVAPSLPATSLANSCYSYMFGECLSLTTVPALPATTLVYACYKNMFYSCTTLTTVPELPAKTLVEQCYYNMFQNCSSLNYIKCLATDISATSCTYNWVNGVSSTGTFVKNPNMSSWTSSVSGIPVNWTVQDNV